MATTQVSSSLIKDASVTAAKMAANSVDSAQYVDGSIDTDHIANGQITVGKMAANSVDSAQYVDGSIDTDHIANGQITVGKMAANSVDSDQYVDGSIDAAHIAASAVGTAALTATIAAGIPTATVGSNGNATANTHHFVGTAGVTLTLPTPTVGMRVFITVGNFVNTVVGRNSSTIAGQSSDLTINVANMSIGLIGTSTSAWVFI